MPDSTAIGIDVGASSVKAAVVDVTDGSRTSCVCRPTPNSRTPDAIAGLIADIVAGVPDLHPVGIAFPGRLHGNVVLEAANLSSFWRNCDAAALFEDKIQRPVCVVNDADAAGVAESRFGMAKGQFGKVLMLTFGTGIGSAMIYGGQLVPGFELGRLTVNGEIAEEIASAAAMNRFQLQQWASAANAFLTEVESAVRPDLIIFGGGISENPDKWWELLRTRTRRELAQLRNDAGVVGAAQAARATSSGFRMCGAGNELSVV